MITTLYKIDTHIRHIQIQGNCHSKHTFYISFLKLKVKTPHETWTEDEQRKHKEVVWLEYQLVNP